MHANGNQIMEGKVLDEQVKIRIFEAFRQSCFLFDETSGQWLRGHCSAPSVNHGLCQSLWMLSIFSIIISAKRSSALSSLLGPSVFRFL